MKVVINVPDKFMDNLRKGSYKGDVTAGRLALSAIKNGTVWTDNTCFADWIPVSSGYIPELHERVIVTHETMDSGVEVDVTERDKHGFYLAGVTAWTRLPDPYKPKEDV